MFLPTCRFANLDRVPYAYNAGGVIPIQDRAAALTDPVALAEYGGGLLWPMYFNELAANGNYVEPEAIAVRKGVCGDPRLVRTFFACPLGSFCRGGALNESWLVLSSTK